MAHAQPEQLASPEPGNHFCFHWAHPKVSQPLEKGQHPETSGHTDPGQELARLRLAGMVGTLGFPGNGQV